MGEGVKCNKICFNKKRESKVHLEVVNFRDVISFGLFQGGDDLKVVSSKVILLTTFKLFLPSKIYLIFIRDGGAPLRAASDQSDTV